MLASCAEQIIGVLKLVKKNIGFPTTSFLWPSTTTATAVRFFTTHISWLGSQILSHIIFKRPINGVAADKVNVGDVVKTSQDPTSFKGAVWSLEVPKFEHAFVTK